MTRKEESENAARALAETKIDDRGYHQCLYDFGMGVEWADTHPQWVSVEDELPHAEHDNATNFGAFLFYTEPINEKGSFEGRYRTGFYNSVTGTYKIRPNHFGNTRVTHWMPLPQPPKKGGEE